MPEPKGLNFGAPTASPTPTSAPPIQAMQPAGIPTGQAVVPFSLQDVVTYGQDTEIRAGSVSQKINATTRGGDIDEVGKLLGQLLTAGQQYDPSKLKPGGVFGFFKKKKRELEAHFATVDAQVTTIARDVDQQITHFASRIGDLEQLGVENQQRHADLGRIIDEANVRIAWMKANPPTPDVTDPFAAQASQNWAKVIEFAEKRVDDLTRVQKLCELYGPQIEMMKENAGLLVMKFGEVKSITLPQMQQTFSLYILNMETEKGADYSKQLTDSNNAMIQANAKKLGVATVKVRTEMARSSVDLATLNTVRDEFFKTMDTCKQIADQTQQRLAAERPQVEAISQQLAQRLAGTSQAA
jgi:uncharacterized protein YaaN involved in tellurite resistance